MLRVLTLAGFLGLILLALAWSLGAGDPASGPLPAPPVVAASAPRANTRHSAVTEEVSSTQVDASQPGQDAPSTGGSSSVSLPLERNPRTSLSPPRLLVRVVDAGTRRPLGGVDVSVDAADGASAELVASVSDAAGLAELLVVPDVELVVRVDGSALHYGSKESRVRGVAAGHERELRVSLAALRDATFHGRLVDAATLAPVEGGRLHLVRDSSPNATSLAARIGRAKSAADGRFELKRPGAGDDRRVWVLAQGYGPVVFDVSPTGGLGAAPFVVRLEADAALEIGVGGTRALSLLELELVASAGVDRLERPGRGRRSDARLTWTRRFAAQEPTTLDGLPTGVPLRVELRRLGEVLWFQENVELRPGELRSLFWQPDLGLALFGVLQGESGEPLADVEMWLVEADDEGSGYFVGDEQPTRTRTDRKGRFVFGDLVSGLYRVGPGARRGAPLVGVQDGPAPYAQALRLEGRDLDVSVRAWQGHRIAGRVIDAGGRGVAGCTVLGYQDDTAGHVATRCDGRGLFSLGPLRPGAFDLVARGRDGGTSPALSVQNERQDVTLRLQPAGRIVVRVVDGAGRPSAAEHVEARENVVRFPALGRASSAAGRAELTGLKPGTYTVLARTRDGRLGVEPAVPVLAGGETRVEVRLEPAATLVVGWAAGPREASFHAVQGSAVVAAGRLGPGHTLRTLVPPGTTQVRLWTDTYARGQQRSLHLEPGQVGAARFPLER